MNIAFFVLAIGLEWTQRPMVTDDRLVLELVAQEPQIVTPTGMTVDEQGHIWVLENHTHHRPPQYQGPPSDRVQVMTEFDSQGRATRIVTFADGLRDSMGITLGKDGAVYVATRSTIYKFRDTRGGLQANERQVLIRLETKATYPHNGLSGFAWDPLGNLVFGFGENEGIPYKMIGTDGTTLTGGGEGGSIYRCRPDGSGLKRIATGFWNPFHLAYDAFGNLFAVDNDPDSRGPCRLLHIIQGGDYGYRYRNGRKGLHPFTAWNGELPGTLPMVAGTAEAPSGIVAYESTGLPDDYRGRLLVTSWGDHVIESFGLSRNGASFTATAKSIVRGDENFRPVAIAGGPEGALYISDWVDKSYPVHGKGKIWRLRAKTTSTAKRLQPSEVAKFNTEQIAKLLHDKRREIREAAGDALASRGVEGLEPLKLALFGELDFRTRVQALWSIARSRPTSSLPLLMAGLKASSSEIRRETIRIIGELYVSNRSALPQGILGDLLKDSAAEVRMEVLLRMREPSLVADSVKLLADPDPFLRAAALEALGRPGLEDLLVKHANSSNPTLRVHILTALRRCATPDARKTVSTFLEDPDPSVRRAAIQWVAEERLREFEPRLQAVAARPPVTRELFEALLAANDRLNAPERRAGDEFVGEDYVAKIVGDPKQPAAFRLLGLRMLRPEHASLKVPLLEQFLRGSDAELKREAVKTLMLRGDEPAQELLRQLATDTKAEQSIRLLSLTGLAQSAPTSATTRKVLVRLLGESEFERDALRALRDCPLSNDEIALIWKAWQAGPTKPEVAEAYWLVLRGSKDQEKLKLLAEMAGPRPKEVASWEQALLGKGDSSSGERIFYHARGPRCYVCHRIEGRGGSIGPDLSTIGASTSREKLIASILTPSKEIAPQYTSWLVTTRNGKLHQGMIVRENADSTITMADTQGKLETLHRNDIEDRQALKTSIMPDNLMDLLTRQEFRDLIAFLESRK